MNSLKQFINTVKRPVSFVIVGSGACYTMYYVTSPTIQNNEMWRNQVLKRQVYEPLLKYPLWNFNWDSRMNQNTTLEAHLDGRASKVQGVTRHLIFIRHGQYEEIGVDGDGRDALRRLTPLGQQQATLTGQRLAQWLRGIEARGGKTKCNITVLRSSDMTRSKETAELIAEELMEEDEGATIKIARPDHRLNECTPAPIIPPSMDSADDLAVKEIDDNRGRMERAFKAHVYRGPQAGSIVKGQEVEADVHEFEVFVGHGNAIRYMFCRALQVPPEAWMRMTIFNCGITYLVIRPNGLVSARMLGDIGHLKYRGASFSMNHGFVW